MTGFNFYEDAERPRAGGWVKLTKKGEKLEGSIMSIEKRPKMFEGKPVLSKKGNPRDEYILTLSTDLRDSANDDDAGVRNYTMNEGDYSAFVEAWRKADKPNPVEGWRVGIWCSKERERSTEWDEHGFKFLEKPKATAFLPESEATDEDPF